MLNEGRLQKGDIIELEGQPWRVVHVTDARAHCVSAAKTKVEFKDRYGKARTFKASRKDETDISPGSLVEILKRKGRRVV